VKAALTALLTVLGPIIASADSTAQAEKFLRESVNRVLAVAKSSANSEVLNSKVTPVLLDIIGFDAMTRRAVGPGWRQFTDSQREAATSLFSRLIIRSYSSRFTPGEYPEIDFRSASEPEPGRVEIATTTVYKGSRYEVVYRLESKDGGSWSITDIVIEGVSMVANYRTQFDAQFRAGGATAVISSIEKSLAKP
jgi:phospholipid transport system substrate-binding protein